MNDTELAERLERLGIQPLELIYTVRGEEIRHWAAPYDFVRDWRVAGAMMEKAIDNNCIVDCALIGRTDAYTMRGPYVAECNTDKKLGHVVDGDNIPRAINEACVEALD